MAVGFKAYGQSPEDGAKPLVYACCAPEEDLRGIFYTFSAWSMHTPETLHTMQTKVCMCKMYKGLA